MGLKSTAVAAAPVMLGVLAAGLALYYFGDKIALFKDAQLGFTNTNATTSSTGTAPSFLQSIGL